MTTTSPPTPIGWSDAAREADFERWFAAVAPRRGLQRATVVPASADASTRRYFRVVGAGGATFIVMDAPEAHDVGPFVRIAGLIEAAGLNAPAVLEADVANGFLLLVDLGMTTYLDAFGDDDA
jgi:aminoglycoside/choline kinase family phosphotransferase